MLSIAVSIHASEGEATVPDLFDIPFNVVSIHASEGEATWCGPTRNCCRGCFNPRLRGGGDQFFLARFIPLIKFQSTPPRGRRRIQRHHGTADTGFNPRLRGGGDRNIWGFLHRRPYILCISKSKRRVTGATQPKSRTFRSFPGLKSCEPARRNLRTWGSHFERNSLLAILYAINVPSRSRLAFAPTCSTRLRHSSPKK